MKLESQLQVSTASGVAPFTVNQATLVSNLNAQYLNGQLGGYYQNAGNLNAGTLLAARLPAFTGDVSSTVGTVGLTLASVGTAGTYRSVTTDAKGRVTAGTNPTTLVGYGITDAIDISGAAQTKSGNLTVSSALTSGGNFYAATTVQYSNRQQIYTVNYGGAQDLAWKKIADVIVPSGLYRGITFKIDVVDNQGNFGWNSNCFTLTYFASCIRSGGVQDDYNNANVTGPVADYVRVVKTATGVYELQIRQLADWQTYIFTAEATINSGGCTVTYASTNPANGSTIGTIYNATATAAAGWTSKLANIAVAGVSSFAGQITSTIATGTAPLVIASTTLVSNLNAQYLNGQLGSYYAAASSLASYLPLAGGTLTGELVVNYAAGRQRIIDGANALILGHWDTVNVRIEASGRPLYMVSYGGAISIGRSSGSNLVVDTASVSYGGNTVLHAGNYTSYPDATKLPLAGGTMTGSIQLSVGGSIGLNGGTTYGIGVAGHSSSAVFDTVDSTGSDPLELNYYNGGPVKIGNGANGSKSLYAVGIYDNGNAVLTSASTSAPSLSIGGSAGAVPWSGITSKPTTLSGFGITDAASINGASNQNFSAYAIYPYDWIRFMGDTGIYWQSGTYTGWHIHPQALWGMSFRSAATTDCGLQLRRSDATSLGAVYSDGTSIGFLTAAFGWGASFTLAGAMNRGSVPGSLVTGNISGSAGSVAWSGITSKPTTLAGFGITDALPLTGGTLTGALTTNVGGTSIFIGNQNVTTSNGLRINFHTDADLSYYIGKKAGAWTQPLDINFYTGIRLYASSSYDYGISFWNSNNTTKMMSVGEGDSNVRVTNTLYIGGNTALHTANYNSYALPLTGGAITGAVSIIGQTVNGQTHYQWSGASFQNAGDWTASLIVRKDNATVGINGHIPSLVLYNNNGGDQTTVGLSFASAEGATGQGNAVPLAGIVARKEGAGTVGNWSSGSLNIYVKNGSARVDALNISSTGTANFPIGLQQGGNQVLHAGNVATYAFAKSGAWAADLVSSYGYTRETGMQMSGGSEFVVLSKSGQGYLLVDGSYIAAEAGGFYSTNNSSGGTLLGFTADTTTSLNFNTTAVKLNGNQVLHAGNFSAYALPYTGGTLTGVLNIQSSYDNQLLLQGTDTWAGIGFRDSANVTDYMWWWGATQTFSIGGGGSTGVSGKKLHIHGGVTIGSSYNAVSMPTNGLNVEGAIQQGGNQVLHAGNYISSYIAKETSYTTPINASGYSWVRIPYAVGYSFNDGQSPIEFYVTRSIFANGNTPYGGCTAKFVIQSQEWHSGQQMATVQYGERGDSASFGAANWITHAKVANQSGGGYWVYLRLRTGTAAGITYYIRRAAVGGQGLDPAQFENTTDPGGAAALYYGFNLISAGTEARFYRDGNVVLDAGNYGGYSTFTGTVTATNFSGPGTSLTGTASSLVAGSANAIADGVVSTSAKIAASVVTYAKIQNVTAYTVLGNSNASGTQAPVEISMATLAGMVGSQYTTNIGNTYPDRVFMSTDANIKYAPIETAKAHLGITSKYGNSRPSITGNTSYWTGAMGWGATDWNTVFDWGSGFTDSWSSPANNPGDTSHHLGIQSVHYTNGSARYGWQMVNGVATGRWWLRDVWGGGFSSWKEVIHSGNIASQTVAVAGSCTGNAASATTAGNVNGYSTSGGVGANTIVIRDSAGYIYANYINTNVSESENPSVNSFFTSNGDGWLRKSTVAHVKYTLSLSGTNTGDQTNISGSSGSCTGNAASVTDGVYLSTNQYISGVKTFSSAPVAENIAKAWVYYNMNNNTIYASYNVSSVTDNGTGVCTVNFSNAMVDANYVVSGTATYGYDDQDIYGMALIVPRRSTAQQAGSCRLATEFIHAAAVYDCVAVRAVFYR